MLLPEPIADACALCGAFEPFWNCESSDQSYFAHRTSITSENVRTRLLDISIYDHDRQPGSGQFTPFFELSSSCSADCKMPKLRLLLNSCWRARMVDWRFVDLDSVKVWIATCDNHHATPVRSCASIFTRTRSAIVLHVIDCLTRCVRLLDTHEPYVCLSYVWGNCVAVEYTVGIQLPTSIPKTI